MPDLASDNEKEEFFRNVVSDKMDRYLRFAYDKDKKIRPKNKKCSFLIPTVKWDGKVTICCHDQLSILNLGNAFETPLKEILGSQKYKIAENKGLQREFHFCKNCN